MKSLSKEMLGCEEKCENCSNNIVLNLLLLSSSEVNTHQDREKLLSLHHCCLSWQETEYSSHWGKMGHYSHCPGSFIQNNPLKVDRSTLNELKGGLIFGDNTSWLFDVGFCDNVLRSLIFRKLGSHKILLY